MEEILQAWHTTRAPILATLVVVLLGVQAWLFVRQTRTRQTTPEAGSSMKASRQSTAAPIRNIPAADASDKAQLDSHYHGGQARPRIPQRSPKRISGKRSRRTMKLVPPADGGAGSIQLLIFFYSISGSTEKAANRFVESIRPSLERAAATINPQLFDLSDLVYDDYFTSLPKLNVTTKYFYVVLVPTYNIDTILNTFLDHLRETHHDFRVDTAPLSEILGYAVFGLGDKGGWPSEEDGFCSQAREVDTWLAKLTGRKRAYPVGMGDVKSDAAIRLDEWQQGVENVLLDLAMGNTLGEGVPGTGDPFESGEEDEELSAARRPRRVQRRLRQTATASLGDLENLETTLNSTGDVFLQPIPVDFTTLGQSSLVRSRIFTPKEMVPKSSPTHAALTKQGYTIVGSHSGVKICRWTKSALRGRGSCYKFSFYGIKSHLCMETTPSLSCSNKCVFCWRHGTNPVSTNWRWQVDPPEMIFEGVKEGHYKKIKMMRGVPGVRAERFEEAMNMRHCALSLVGEPIFYPRINEFTALLHHERISSFLVCNAQHPDQLATLKPVTQLYVSIDASNKDSLRKIDRPLHRDFWERFNHCLDIIREKRFCQRTVFRLTLVKGFNIEHEAEGYADLVGKGLPCFVEVKGVTFCGTSSSAGVGLTMENVPFYEEVCAFVVVLNSALERRGLRYGIAAEHAHSCCILIASHRFCRKGRWHTVIDYERFFECLESEKPFAPEDYVAETPEWALWGNGGFDPADTRVKLKGKNKVREVLVEELVYEG